MLSPRPWKLDAVLRLALGVFVCLFLGTLLATLLKAAGGDTPGATVQQIVVSALFFQGASIALVWRFVREHEMGWADAFGLRRASNRAAAVGALVIIGFFPAGILLQNLSLQMLERLGIETSAQQAVQALRSAGQGMGLLAFVVITVAVAPVGEELLFRGVLYPAIKRAGYPKLALWGTSILFAAIHFNLPIFLPLLLLSLVLVWTYEHTDNLLAPVTAHALFNAANLVSFFWHGNPAARLPTSP